jgi:hypothetical protein
MNGPRDEVDLMDPIELKKLMVYEQLKEEQKLVQFFMALHPAFEPTEGLILHHSPLLSVDL